MLPTAIPRHLIFAGNLARQFRRGAVGDDPSLSEENHPAGKLVRLIQIVGGDQDCRVLAARHTADQPVKFASGARIQAGGGFVEEQQFRSANGPDRLVQPSLLTAGEHPDCACRLFGQPDCDQQLIDVPWRPNLLGGVLRVVRLLIPPQLSHAPLAVIAPGLHHDSHSRPQAGAIQHDSGPKVLTLHDTVWINKPAEQAGAQTATKLAA